jgi:hypothetical protein
MKEQFHDQLCFVSRFTLHLNLPTMKFNNLSGDCQPQSKATLTPVSSVIHPVETVKDTRLFGCWNAGAAIFI